jgi:dolichol-phosphate mannosyltransferase
LLKEVMAADAAFISEEGFSCTADILLKLRAASPELRVREVPLILRYDRKQGVSKMKVFRTVVQSLGLVVRRRCGAGS